MKDNFTLSKDWINSFPIRYDINKLIVVNKSLYFYKQKKLLQCQHYFSFDISDKTFQELGELIEKGYILKFNYVDKKLFEILKNWGRIKNYRIEELDKWSAPLLQTNDIEKYLAKNKHSQVRKNYKKYKKANFKYIVSNDKNILELWNDVLYIDLNSWKKTQKSDMKSLNREDLQYIFYMLNNKDKVSLNVAYDQNLPCAYSLMFKYEAENKWYAVKWGASEYGRTKQLGIYCLLDHLIKIGSKTVSIDFWGRRNKSYDSLKNCQMERMHLEIKKEV